MAYTSKYTGNQIDTNIGKIPTLESNIATAQNSINTINNTYLTQIRSDIEILSNQFTTLNNSLKTDFVGYTVYTQKIAEIEETLQSLNTNLTNLDSVIQTKVGLDTHITAISSLEDADKAIKELISTGDLTVKSECQQSISENSDRITVTEADIASIKTNINTINNTTIPSLQTSINIINDTDIPQIKMSVETIANDYITTNELNSKASEVLSTASGTYATQETVNDLESTLTNDYLTSDNIATKYVAKTDYESNTTELEKTIATLQSKIITLENKVTSLENKVNSGWT